MPPAKLSLDDQNFNISFVAEVKKYPCLYDSTSQEYKCAANQDRAWIRVAESVNDNPESCKKKWRNLRCCVTRYLKGLRESGLQRKPYYLFDHMKFVIPFLKTKIESDSTVEAMDSESKIEDPKQEISQNHEYSEVEIDFSDNNLKENILNSIKVLPVISTNNESHQHITTDQYEIFEVSQPSSKKFCSVSSTPINQYKHDQQTQADPQQQATSSNSSFMQHQMASQQQHQQQNSQSSTSANSVIAKEADDNFFKSLIPDIQEMNKDQKRKLKIGILKLIDDILSS